MIETRRLKNVVIFLEKILSFVLSRKIIKMWLYFGVRLIMGVVQKPE